MMPNRTRYLLISLTLGIILLVIIGGIIYLAHRDNRRVVHQPDACPRPQHYATDYDFDYNKNSREHRNVNSTIDYFRMSLSWSPTFCQGRQKAQDHFQCQHAFGFIVHGLWPSKVRENGTSFSLRSHPRNCRNEKEIPIEIIQKYFCLMPSEKLMQAEWEKHGTCYWQNPEDYFEQINHLYSKIRRPGNIEEILTNQTMTRRARREAIKQSFLNVNSRLTGDHLEVMMANKGRKLKQVDFCYDLQFNPIKCN